MGQLMKEGFEGQGCQWIDGDLAAAPGVSLAIAVEVLERDALDLQSRKRLLLVPFGNNRRLILLTFGLRENKPVALVSEMGIGEFLFLLGPVVFLDGPGPLAGKGHAKDQRLFALLDAPSQLLPLPE